MLNKIKINTLKKTQTSRYNLTICNSKMHLKVELPSLFLDLFRNNFPSILVIPISDSFIIHENFMFSNEITSHISKDFQRCSQKPHPFRVILIAFVYTVYSRFCRPISSNPFEDFFIPIFWSVAWCGLSE